MFKPPVRDDDIEHRIAQRDRLLLHAQGARPPAPEAGPAQMAELTARVARLEQALARYLDPEWMARSAMDELAQHAREALGL